MSMIDPPDVQPGTAPLPAMVLDPQALERLRELDPGGQSKLLARVVDAFATAASRLVPQINKALEAGDLAAIHHVAHTLKSSSASIGAIKLSRLCAAIEDLSRASRSEGLPAAIAEFNSEVSAVQDALYRVLEHSA